MRKIILISILLALPLVCFGQESTSKTDSEPDAFRGIKWGTHIEKLSNMEHAGQLWLTDKASGISKPLDRWIRKNELLKMGDAELERIEYQTYNYKLSRVVIYVNNQENFETLLKAISKECANNECYYSSDSKGYKRYSIYSDWLRLVVTPYEYNEWVTRYLGIDKADREDISKIIEGDEHLYEEVDSTAYAPK